MVRGITIKEHDMKFAKYITGTALFALLSVQAVAAPVTYTFTGNWTNAPTGDFGASYIATLVFDNGGSSAANQSFGQSSFISGRVQSGSYDFSMAPVDITSWAADFSSNGSGQLDAGWFDAANSGNNWHFDLDFDDAGFSNASGGGSFLEQHISNPGTVGAAASATAVPTMPLYSLMLTLFGLLVVALRRL